MPDAIRIGLRLKSDTASPYLLRLAASLTGQGRRTVTRSMARAFYEQTLGNFGVSGIDRPHSWPALSEGYKKYLRKKSFGTPLVPTLLRRGTLMNSIRIQTNTDSTSVYTDNPYAAVHQFGFDSRGIPARPYFPVVNGELTPSANQKVQNAATQEIVRIVRDA